MALFILNCLSPLGVCQLFWEKNCKCPTVPHLYKTLRWCFVYKTSRWCFGKTANARLQAMRQGQFFFKWLMMLWNNHCSKINSRLVFSQPPGFFYCPPVLTESQVQANKNGFYSLCRLLVAMRLRKVPKLTKNATTCFTVGGETLCPDICVWLPVISCKNALRSVSGKSSE